MSKTIIAALVGIVASVVGLFGIQLDAGLATEFVVQMTTLISLGVAIYGRATAKTEIQKPLPKERGTVDVLSVTPGVRSDHAEVPPARSSTDPAPKPGLPGFEDLDRFS